jgi:hypothetical protein
MFSADAVLAKYVFPPKNGPVPSRPVNAYPRSYSIIPHPYEYLYEGPMDRAAARASLGLRENGFAYFVFGAVRANKNYDRVIECFRQSHSETDKLLVARRGPSIVVGNCWHGMIVALSPHSVAFSTAKPYVTSRQRTFSSVPSAAIRLPRILCWAHCSRSGSYRSRAHSIGTCCPRTAESTFEASTSLAEQ